MFIFSQMRIIAYQLRPIVSPDFIVELFHEKAFSDRGSGFVVE